jgi:pimeloyl-ACP methyl ester carboxylesterase
MSNEPRRDLDSRSERATGGRFALWLSVAAFGAATAFAFLLLTPHPVPVSSPAATANTNAATADAREVGLEPLPCWFKPPADRRARCGVLRVPERRTVPRSRELGLRFTVLSPVGAATGDPIVYISGGPGEPAQLDAASISYWWSWIDREPWLRDRDLVLFDQRGVGVSEPRMDCPELVAAARTVLQRALPLDASNEVWAAAAGRCHDRLAASGIDLQSYNTSAIAADLKDLLTELGYRSPILLASSYGTRVALRLAGDPTVGIAGMVLDAPDPPEARDYVESAASAAAAFAALFQSCAAEAACHNAFPSLAADFDHIVARAAVAPLQVTVSDPNGDTFSAQLDDAKLVETLFYAFYDWRRLQELPAIIAALASGDNRPLAPLVRLGLETYDREGASLGLFLSVECHDDFFFNSREEIERVAATVPRFRKFALSNLPLAACPAWPVGRAGEAEHAPLTRDVPILLFAGELDPATPPRWAESVQARLPRAYLFKFPSVGHGVLGAQACASRLVGRFFADLSRRPTDDCLLLALGPPRFRKVAAVEAPRAPVERSDTH